MEATLSADLDLFSRRPDILSAMDVTTADFEREVIEASRHLPVIVDFWAPWCGPCRALTPVIEKVAVEFAGRIKLVKVNSDENPELSSAFAIRSIPNVIAFRDGQAVAQFMGAQPEQNVRAFMAQLLPSPGELALEQAESLLAEGDLDAAEQALDTIEPDPRLASQVAALRYRVSILRAGAGGPNEATLAARLAADADDHAARLALAQHHAAAARYREAMDALLEIIRRARDWRDGEARRELLAVFDLAADDHALVAEYRRKLASVLH